MNGHHSFTGSFTIFALNGFQKRFLHIAADRVIGPESYPLDH